MIAIIDISVAFMHADIEEHIIVKVPPGVTLKTRYWKFKKAVNGTRKASRSFQEFCAKHVIEWGFRRNDHNPALYYDADRDVNVEEHGDDFLVDFQQGLDRIAIVGSDGFEDLLIAQTGADVTVSFGATDVRVLNQTEAEFTEDDFLF